MDKQALPREEGAGAKATLEAAERRQLADDEEEPARVTLQRMVAELTAKLKDASAAQSAVEEQLPRVRHQTLVQRIAAIMPSVRLQDMISCVSQVTSCCDDSAQCVVCSAVPTCGIQVSRLVSSVMWAHMLQSS